MVGTKELMARVLGAEGLHVVRHRPSLGVDGAGVMGVESLGDEGLGAFLLASFTVLLVSLLLQKKTLSRSTPPPAELSDESVESDITPCPDVGCRKLEKEVGSDFNEDALRLPCTRVSSSGSSTEELTRPTDYWMTASFSGRTNKSMMIEVDSPVAEPNLPRDLIRKNRSLSPYARRQGTPVSLEGDSETADALSEEGTQSTPDEGFRRCSSIRDKIARLHLIRSAQKRRNSASRTPGRSGFLSLQDSIDSPFHDDSQASPSLSPMPPSSHGPAPTAKTNDPETFFQRKTRPTDRSERCSNSPSQSLNLPQRRDVHIPVWGLEPPPNLVGCNEFEQTSCLFLEILDYHDRQAQLSPLEMQEWMSKIHSAIEDALDRNAVIKVETRANCCLCCSGTDIGADDPESQLERLVNFATQLSQDLNGADGCSMRFGIATGPLVISENLASRDSLPAVCAWGDIVNTAARMETRAIPGYIRMTEEAALKFCEEDLCRAPRWDTAYIKGKVVISLSCPPLILLRSNAAPRKIKPTPYAQVRIPKQGLMHTAWYNIDTGTFDHPDSELDADPTTRELSDIKARIARPHTMSRSGSPEQPQQNMVSVKSMANLAFS